MCVPFTTLRLGEIEKVNTLRAPSAADHAVTKSKKRLEWLTQGQPFIVPSTNIQAHGSALVISRQVRQLYFSIGNTDGFDKYTRKLLSTVDVTPG